MAEPRSAFNSDGTLRPANSGVWKPGEQGVQLILHKGSSVKEI